MKNALEYNLQAHEQAKTLHMEMTNGAFSGTRHFLLHPMHFEAETFSDHVKKLERQFLSAEIFPNLQDVDRLYILYIVGRTYRRFYGVPDGGPELSREDFI